MKRLCMAVMAMCLLLSCGEKREEATLSGLMKSDFVSEVEGKPTALYVLKNKNGAEACITNYGGRLVSVMVPDKNGKMTDVVLGYDNNIAPVEHNLEKMQGNAGQPVPLGYD